MIDDNTTNTNDTPVTDPPPGPNGHGASNGANPELAETIGKTAQSSSKKKNKRRHADDKKPVTVQAPIEIDPSPTATAAVTATEAPIAEASTAEQPPSAAPAETVESLRLRMKIWTDPQTSKRYLMPTAFMRDIVNGRPTTDVMYAYAMRDDDTKLVTLRAAEWNTLPFFYFQEDGPAPRASVRPVDVVG